MLTNKGLSIKRYVIPPRFRNYGYKYLQIKTDSLHFNLILFHFKSNVLEKIQINRNCTTVQILIGRFESL